MDSLLTFVTQEQAIHYMEQSGYKLEGKSKSVMKNDFGATVRVVNGKVEWTTKGD